MLHAGKEMPAINLYTLADARIDIDKGLTGLEASLRKWNAIIAALTTIKEVMDEKCGMCLEYMRDPEEGGEPCRCCPLYRRGEDSICFPEYDISQGRIDSLIGGVQDLISKLDNLC